MPEELDSYRPNFGVLFSEGVVLAITGAIGAQLGTRVLQKLPDVFVSLAIRTVLVVVAVYIFWQTKFATPCQLMQSLGDNGRHQANWSCE